MSQYQISESLIHLYQEGGFIMIPLALLSIISLSILSEKLLFYLKYLGSYFRRCRFDIPQSVLLYQNNPHNFYHKQILFESLTNEHKIASRFYLQKSQKEVYKIQRSLWFLQMSIQLAPILGVLGTIIGVMQSIQGVDLSKGENITMISKGFSKALITSIYGLSLASILQFSYSLIDSYLTHVESTFRSIYQSLLHWEKHEF